MAQAIFDGVSPVAESSFTIASRRVGEADTELARVLDQRQRQRLAPVVLDHPVFARPRRRGRCSMAAVFEHALLSAGGGLLARHVHASLITLDHSPTVDSWQAVVRAIRAPDVDTTVAERHSLQDAVAARIHAARERLVSLPRLHQASLFDRRAEREAGLRQTVVASLDAALAHRAATIRDPQPHSARARLIAVWPIEGQS